MYEDAAPGKEQVLGNQKMLSPFSLLLDDKRDGGEPQLSYPGTPSARTVPGTLGVPNR